MKDDGKGAGDGQENGLHLVCGSAGAGKSTFARKLAAELCATLLDSDTVTEPVVRAGMVAAGRDPDDRDSPSYQKAFRDPVYECLFAAAVENLSHLPVVIVGPFSREIRCQKWPDELKERFGVEVTFYHVSCSDAARRKRIEERGNQRDAWKLAHWDLYLAKSTSEPPVFKHRAVRT